MNNDLSSEFYSGEIADAVLAEVQRNKAAAFDAALKETEEVFNVSMSKVKMLLTAEIDPDYAEKMFREAVKHHLICLGYIVALREKMAAGWSLEGFDKWWKSDNWDPGQREEL